MLESPQQQVPSQNLCGPVWGWLDLLLFQFNSFHFMSLALRLHRLPLTQAQYATACRLVLGLEYALQRGVAKEDLCSTLNLKALEYLKGWNIEQLLIDLESRKKRWFVHASRLQLRTWQTQRKRNYVRHKANHGVLPGLRPSHFLDSAFREGPWVQVVESSVPFESSWLLSTSYHAMDTTIII